MRVAMQRRPTPGSPSARRLGGGLFGETEEHAPSDPRAAAGSPPDRGPRAAVTSGRGTTPGEDAAGSTAGPERVRPEGESRTQPGTGPSLRPGTGPSTSPTPAVGARSTDADARGPGGGMDVARTGGPAHAGGLPREGHTERLLEGLNPPQREAVRHERGALLILAGAGSGKTRVITRRIAWLCEARGARPDSILAITFTNKAAGEMRQRTQALFAGPAGSADSWRNAPWISTFHALCARILRRDIEMLGGYTRDFSIYDTSDRNQAIKKALQGEGFDATQFKPAQIGAWISERKNRGATVESELAALDGDSAGIAHEAAARAWRAYEAQMRAANALDFDDLMLKVLELFELHPGVRDGYARRFRHVMVDEYQDTNRVQYLLMRHLAAEHESLSVCGDPDQSIYGWRGADVRNILDFERDFPGAVVVRLEQNYRSTQTILDAAQAVIRKNRQRKEKALWSERGAGEKLVLLECSDEDDEGREIASRIRELAAQGVGHDRIAVFYRVNFMQRAIERALRLAQVPYQIVAGTEFYQRREIKDLVAWLRLIVNPNDVEAAKRALQAPSRGIGDKTIELVERFVLDRRVDWRTAASSSELLAQVRGKGRAGLEAFGAALARLTEFAAAPGPIPAGLVLARAVEELDYYTFLDQAAEPGEVDRAANVEELISYADEYDLANPEGGLRGFLQDIALVSDSDAYAEGEPKVTMMTLHAAKGLEFPCVFIAGLEEELLPHVRALVDSEDPDLAVEEERRLFYVGMTRAQDRLFLSRAQVRRHFGQQAFTTPSRFLDELPRELVAGAEDDEPEERMLGRFDETEEARFDFAVGDQVVHADFGRGQVLRLSGAGANARATVRFERAGEKTLLLVYAKLAKAGGGRR